MYYANSSDTAYVKKSTVIVTRSNENCAPKHTQQKQQKIKKGAIT